MKKLTSIFVILSIFSAQFLFGQSDAQWFEIDAPQTSNEDSKEEGGQEPHFDILGLLESSFPNAAVQEIASNVVVIQQESKGTGHTFRLTPFDTVIGHRESEEREIQPFQSFYSLKTLLRGSEDNDVFLNVGGPSCPPAVIQHPPALNSGVVEATLTASCEASGQGPHKWVATLRLIGPEVNGNRNKTKTVTTLYGSEVTFDRSNTLVSLGCQSGSWESDLKMTYKRGNGWFGGRTIHHLSMYASITCP